MISLSLHFVLENFGGKLVADDSRTGFIIAYDGIEQFVRDDKYGTVRATLEKEVAAKYPFIGVTPMTQTGSWSRRSVKNMIAEQEGSTFAEKVASLEKAAAAMSGEAGTITMAELVELDDISGVVQVKLTKQSHVALFKNMFPGGYVDAMIGYVEGVAPKFDSSDLLLFLESQIGKDFCADSGNGPQPEETPAATKARENVPAGAGTPEKAQDEASGGFPEVKDSCVSDREALILEKLQWFHKNMNVLPKMQREELYWVDPAYENIIPKAQVAKIGRMLPCGPAPPLDYVDQALISMKPVLFFVKESDRDLFVIGMILRLKGSFNYDGSSIVKK